MKIKFLLLASCLALYGATAAYAQTTPDVATVVAACGTPPSTYSAGTNRAVLQDTNGKVCTSTSGGGGGGDVNLTGINGVTPTVGAGATSSGSLRTTQAQDTTTVAGAAPTTTGIYVTGPAAAALATSALQTTGNSSLSTIGTNTGATTTAITAVTGTKAAGTAAASALLTGGVYSSTPPTLTNGQQAAAQVSAAGRLLVDAAITGGGDATAANQTVVQGVIGAATAPTKMNVAGGVYNSSPLTLTNGQASAIQVDATGATKVTGGLAAGTSATSQLYSPISGLSQTACNAKSDTTAQLNPPNQDLKGNLCVNLGAIGGVAPGTAGTAASAVLTVQGIASMTPVQVSQATAASLNATVVGTGTFATQSTLVGATTGGATAYGLQSAASTNSTTVKASAGTLVAMNLENTTTTVYYLRMYNASSAPTCSSATNFVRSWAVPPAPAAGQVGGIAVHLPVNGTAFSAGISFCVTGGPSSTDNTNAATGVLINLDYF